MPGGWRLRSVLEIATEPARRADGATDDHPAMMPMAVARRCVEITSLAEGVVLDPYAGSGTTLLAARIGLRWVGVEFMPAYVDLVELRMRAGP